MVKGGGHSLAYYALSIEWRVLCSPMSAKDTMLLHVLQCIDAS